MNNSVFCIFLSRRNKSTTSFNTVFKCYSENFKFFTILTSFHFFFYSSIQVFIWNVFCTWKNRSTNHLFFCSTNHFFRSFSTNMDNFINCRSCLSSCCCTTNFHTIFNGNCVSCFCFSCNTFLNNFSLPKVKVCIWDMLYPRFNNRSLYFSSSSYDFFNFSLRWSCRLSWDSRFAVFCWLSWNFRLPWNSRFNNFFFSCFTYYSSSFTSFNLTFITWQVCLIIFNLIFFLL